jgi:hypothetical protein
LVDYHQEESMSFWNWLRTREDVVGNGLELIARAIRLEKIEDSEFAKAKPLVQDGLRRILMFEDKRGRIGEYYEWAAQARHPNTGEKLEREILDGTWLAGTRRSNGQMSKRFPFTEAEDSQDTDLSSSEESHETSSMTLESGIPS